MVKPNQAKAKKVSAPAAASTGDVEAVLPATLAHMNRVHEAMKTIMDNPIFQNVASAEPLNVKQGATQAPFDETDFKDGIADHGKYRCSGNFCWQDLVWLVNHRVPVNQKQIKDYQQFAFPAMDPPADCPLSVHIAVEKVKDMPKPNAAVKYQRISPEEPVHAFLFSLEEAVIKAPEDQALLGRWLKLCLTTPMTFEMVPAGEERYWRAQNIREHQIEKGDTVHRSTRQRIYDVAGFKIAKEREANKTIGADKIEKMYKRVKLATRSEKITFGFIDASVTIYNRILKLPKAAVQLEWLDENLPKAQNPIASVWTLQYVIERAQSPERIVFALEGLVDHYRMGLIDLGVFSHTKLKDSRQSYVEVLSLKMSTLSYMLTELLANSGIAAASAAKIREVYSSFATTRQFSTAYPDSPEPNTSWRLHLKPSALVFCDLLED